MLVQVKYKLEGVLDVELPDDMIEDRCDMDSYVYDLVRDEVEASSYNVEFIVRDAITGGYVDLS